MPLSTAAAHVQASQNAWQNFHIALQAFRVAMARESVEGMEKERLEAVSHLESYLDNLAQATIIAKNGGT